MSRAFTVLSSLLLSLLLLTACEQPKQPTMSLYQAVHQGDLNQLKRHLAWDTPIDQPDANGDLPLHVAADQGRYIITQLLLDHGADPNAFDQAGRTPIERALLAGRIQVAQLLLKEGARLDPTELLYQIARHGPADRDVIGFLVQQGAQINQPDAAGDTALHIAIQAKHRVVSKFLIAQGADVNAVNQAGKTPLQLAIADGQQQLIDLLRWNGAK